MIGSSLTTALFHAKMAFEWDELFDSATSKLKGDDCMSELNAKQQEAVDNFKGRMTVDATAGSGKTHTLVRRVKNMLDNGVKPGSIMMTTFTKKASEEMTTRLGTLVPKIKVMQMTIGTTHSIGYRILAKEYDNMNHPMSAAFKKRNILMGSKQKYFAEEVVKEIMYDRKVPYGMKEEIKEIPIPAFLKAIGLSKNQGEGAPEYEALNYGKNIRMDSYIEFYNRYESKKFSERAIDADDMLFLLWKLFKEHPDVLAKYQKIYEYILVDEAQDNNTIQYELFGMLAYPQNNLLLVGDCDQSMYGFRGARPDEFINYANTRGMQRVALESNYRSNPAILDVANSLIVNNKQRLDKKLIAHKEDDSDCVGYTANKDEGAEANDIVSDIEAQINNGRKHKDLAILYRTNAQSRALEDKLILAGFPYVIHGGISFYERKEVKDIVAYLQLATNPKANDDAFKRVINVPSRYLGKAYMEKVKAFKGSHWDAIQPGKLNMKNHETNGSNEFIKLINELRVLSKDEDTTPSDLVDYLLEDGGYKAYILGEEEEEESSRMENIATLKFVLGNYNNTADFLNYIELMTSKAKHSIDGVQLMTIHKSKGLEFPVVYVAGVTEGLLPHFRAIEDSMDGSKPYALEEERRLLYVAITRAEEECYISSTLRFNGKDSPASRFVKELGMNLSTKSNDEEVERTYDKEVLEPIRREHNKMMGDILND